MSTSGDQRKLVGSRIRAIRAARGLSQAALAELVGVRQHRLSEWETGVILPSPSSLERLAEALGCRWTDFYVAGPEPANAA